MLKRRVKWALVKVGPICKRRLRGFSLLTVQLEKLIGGGVDCKDNLGAGETSLSKAAKIKKPKR